MSWGLASTPPTRLRGYTLGQLARARGAFVVFGGIHATLFPDEVRERGAAHAVVTGDGDHVWRLVLADCAHGALREPVQRRPDRGRGVLARALGPAAGRPLHVGLGPDGARLSEALLVLLGLAHRRPEAAPAAGGRRRSRSRRPSPPGFRFVLLADDNFYPVTLADLAAAERRSDKTSARRRSTALRQERFELMAQLERLPDDMVFYTQITMEAAEDPEFLAAMRRARIRGALVGVESVTPEGLKAVFKNFNDAGEALVTRLQAFKANGVHVLGSFIFGLPTDTPTTFDATADLAQRAGVSFAQFVMLTPFPGTVDFAKWETGIGGRSGRGRHSADPLLADPLGEAPEGLRAASADVGGRDSRAARRASGIASTRCPRSGSDRTA